MEIAVVDGLGGGLGSQIIKKLQKELPQAELLALGTNSQATSRMIDNGADRGATGENALCVNVNKVDYIIGPLGIIIPDAMMGEVTPDMAEAISNSSAERYILGIKQPHVNLIGLAEYSLNELIDQLIAEVKEDFSKAD